MRAKGKDSISKKIWNLLEERDLVNFPKPCYGRIPHFKGARIAGERISNFPEFSEAKCIFCAPDIVLRRVREIVLEDGRFVR